MATKSSDGRMCVWRFVSSSSSGGGGGGSEGSPGAALEAVAVWKVPHCSGTGSWANRCHFGTTRDGRYIAVVSRQVVGGLLIGSVQGRLGRRFALLQATWPDLHQVLEPRSRPCWSAGQQQGRLLCI